ncbi:TPA: hypothetical protein N0F65_008587 [Lagenidium giganteum]|uniref:Transposase n=1 Tax=Lagenidium giganteum TaxID=4803 RepID=A0AAV2Z2L1_9STRA|nr:TPA: hypothetical protein N0F65_008587 [Lagenidium giganteum]
MSPNAIVAMLEKDHGRSVAPQTVRNRINDSGLNGRASLKKPYLSMNHKRIRLQGCAFDQRYLTPTFKSQRESVMVWGCMSWEGVGALQICDRNVNAQYYMEILEDNLDATKEVLCLPDDTEFLHDGASCPRAKTVKEYLRRKGINLVKHPALSPDLNPIENVWAHVKAQLYPPCHNEGGACGTD